MSTIDQRVVEMRFDNKQFESGVATTMSTLEKFKQSLNLTGASKGLENVSSAAKRCDVSALGTAVETVKSKFSALEVMGITALANITNSAVNAGKKMVSALTIDPIKSGFAEYETQINAVQTILANTQHAGTDLDDVNKVLDDLNSYADRTIYNFTEMTRNIGTFTAAGLGLDESAAAIKGIANLAAVSGSTSHQASTAMYQLSQALANGTVNLQDWNSVVNAGMGGKVFQDALVRTAAAMQGVTEETFRANNITGSFRESISTKNGSGWLTADVLSKTLQQFTGDMTDAELAAMGFTEDQIKNIQSMAVTANEAATKVKTFTQLWDTLKEAAQSGWTQTWEIIVGDFEEAKELLTEISDTIGKVIGDSANARNELLQGWKDAGGRKDLIDGLRNAFEGMVNVIKPIKEAFREIFPPITVKNLTDFTTGFKNLTARFAEFTKAHGPQIKSIFKGIFSVLDIGWEAVKTLAGGIAKLFGNIGGFSGSILDAAASLGDWLTNLRESIDVAGVFSEVLDKIREFAAKVVDKFRELTTAAPAKVFEPGRYEGFLGLMQTVWEIVSKIGSAIGKVFSALGKGLSEAFTGWDFNTIINAINGGLITGILVTIKNFTKGIFESFNGEGGFLKNITGILDDVRGCFQAYQDQLKAGTLLKIASAIGILAAAVLVISTIDPYTLGASLSAITVLFGELMGSLAIFTKISGNMGGVAKGVTVMIGMSVALVILAGALKKISTLDVGGIAKGLVSIGVLMTEMSIFLRTAKFDGKMMGTATGMVIISSAMLILASAVKRFGEMDWGEIGKGLAAIGGLLLELAIFSNLTGNAKHVVSTGVSMVLLGAAMKIFASAVKDFSGMNWEEIGRGLAAMAGALTAVTLALNLMPKNMLTMGVGLVAVAGAMMILANAMSSFGGMSWEEIGRGLVAMGGALLELSIALNLMNGTLAGSAALVIAAGALAILAPVMKSLGEMTWQEIATALITMAGAFAVIGVAGALLTPVIPSILALAGAMALFGVSIIGIGAGLSLIGVGLSLISAGFTALAVALSAGATSIVAALTIIVTGLANLIPSVCVQIANGIIAFAQVIADGAPTIAQAVGALLSEMLGLLVTYIPILVDTGMRLLIGLLQGVADNIQQVVETAVLVITNFIAGIASSMPNIIQSGIDLMLSFINGMADGIRNNTQRTIDATNNLMDAIIGAIKAYFKNAKDRGKELLSNMMDGIKSKLSSAISTAKNIGKNIIDGLVSGVKNAAKSVVNAAKNVVSNALDAAKDFLGINSPSRAFAELGMGMDEGLVVGLSKYARIVKNAAVDVGQEAVNTMSDAVSGVSSIFGSSIDAQPTIRPVLDLSNIQNGASRLNGMFGQQTVALSGIGTGMSNSLNSLLNQMQGYSGVNNDDVVSAISELRSDFGNLIGAIGSMQIRMDSGTVVGELIGKIDSSLGQIAIHKGRGVKCITL